MILPDEIARLRDAGALFALSDSGGKDSQAMRIAVLRVVPAAQVVVVHASLGDVEWPGALEHAQAGAERNGLPFIVALARKTFFEMVAHRYAVRPGAPSWPSASTRQCTSDLKRGPITRELRRVLRERGLCAIVSCMGIRAEESPHRAKASVVKRSDLNSVAGRDWWEWLPIHEMTRAEVFALIASSGETPHPAYALGNDRLSCMFCIFGSKNDLRNAAIANPALYRRYVEMEQRTGYTMHQSRQALTVLTGVEVPA